MRIRLFLCFVLVLVGSALSSVSSNAEDNARPLDAPLQLAQLQLKFGGSDKDMLRSLRREGYSEIQVVKTGFSKVRVFACYQGARYDVKIKRFSGKVTRVSKIGDCRPVLDERQIVKKLRRDGYRRISIYNSAGNLFRLVACRRGDRFRMELNQYGDTVRQDNVGPCRRELNLAEVRQRLRDEGYNRLRLVRERDRVFVFEACRRNKQLRIRVRRNGVIAGKKRIGRCNPPISVRQLSGIMENRGLERVAVIDRKLPVYIAEGCNRNNKLIRVKFNRFGDVLNESRVGDCDPPLGRDDVIALIREGGANRITVEVDRDGNFVARSCYRGKMYRSRFDKYGKMFGQRITGNCPAAPRLNQIVDRFEGRNLNRIQLFVEGCRKGRHIRIEIDEFGDVLDRQRVGNCR